MPELLKRSKGGNDSGDVGFKSQYLKQKLLNLPLGGAAFSAPATVYFAAFTVSPTQKTDTATEPTGNNYSRVSVTNNTTNFPTATLTGDGTRYQKLNAAALNFPAPSGSWGNISAIGIYDASTSGNLLYYMPLATPQAVNAANPLSFPANTIQVTET